MEEMYIISYHLSCLYNTSLFGRQNYMADLL